MNVAIRLGDRRDLKSPIFQRHGGPLRPLFTDYRTGATRTVFHWRAAVRNGSEFGSAVSSERTVRIIRDGAGATSAIALQRPTKKKRLGGNCRTLCKRSHSTAKTPRLKAHCCLRRGSHPAVVLLYAYIAGTEAEGAPRDD